MAEAEQMVTLSIAFLAQVAHGMVCCTWVEMQFLWLYNFGEKESVSYRFAHSLWAWVLSDSWFPCSAELQFRDEVFKEYLW